MSSDATATYLIAFSWLVFSLSLPVMCTRVLQGLQSSAAFPLSRKDIVQVSTCITLLPV